MNFCAMSGALDTVPLHAGATNRRHAAKLILHDLCGVFSCKCGYSGAATWKGLASHSLEFFVSDRNTSTAHDGAEICIGEDMPTNRRHAAHDLRLTEQLHRMMNPQASALWALPGDQPSGFTRGPGGW